MMVNPNMVKNLIDYGPKIISWFEIVGNELDKFAEGMDQLFPESNLNIVEEVVDDTLTKSMLFDIIRKNVATGANGMAIIYKKGTGDDDIFYLASTKDKELIDEKDNKFIVVKVTDGIKKEVKEIFTSAVETEFGKLIIIK